MKNDRDVDLKKKASFSRLLEALTALPVPQAALRDVGVDVAQEPPPPQIRRPD